MQICMCTNCSANKQQNSEEWHSNNFADTISLSTFLRNDTIIRVVNRVINDSVIQTFNINTLLDTIYIKEELHWLSDIERSHPTVAWGKNRFAYSHQLWDVPLNHKEQFVNRDTLKSYIISTHREFFKLVQEWDTITMRSIERPIRCTNLGSTTLYRVIFRNGKYKIDKFRFNDLNLYPEIELEQNKNIYTTALIQN